MLNYTYLTEVKEIILLQVLAYAQHARESSNYELAALNERMQEYKRQVDQEGRRSFNGSFGSPSNDMAQPFPRSSHKIIEAVMQSAVEGKVLDLILISSVAKESFFGLFLSFCWLNFYSRYPCP